MLISSEIKWQGLFFFGWAANINVVPIAMLSALCCNDGCAAVLGRHCRRAAFNRSGVDGPMTALPHSPRAGVSLGTQRDTPSYDAPYQCSSTVRPGSADQAKNDGVTPDLVTGLPRFPLRSQFRDAG